MKDYINHYCVITVRGVEVDATYPKPEAMTERERKIARTRLAYFKRLYPNDTVKLVERKEREVAL